VGWKFDGENEGGGVRNSAIGGNGDSKTLKNSALKGTDGWVYRFVSLNNSDPAISYIMVHDDEVTASSKHGARKREVQDAEPLL